MAITLEGVREIFKGLENGDGAAFFERVADDVDWTVMGTHPLAGHYASKKAFVEGTFAKLSQVLPKGTQLHVVDLIVKGDQAVVELHSLATAKNSHTLRQPLLLGGVFPEQRDRSRSGLPRFGHGRPIVRGESDWIIGCNGCISVACNTNPREWRRSRLNWDRFTSWTFESENHWRRGEVSNEGCGTGATFQSTLPSKASTSG